MRMGESFRAAVFNIWGAKLRSFLAVLGILIGTASVVALIMSGQLATRHALEQFRALGTNLLAVSVYQQNQEKHASTGVKLSHLTLQQAEDSVEADSHIQIAAPYTMNYSSVYYNDQNLNASVIGATSALAKVIKINLQKGRFVSMLDRNQHFAVIGNMVLHSLQKLGLKHPIGKQIIIGKDVFTIIGEAKLWPQNNFFEQDINSSIIIPIDSSLNMNRYTQIQNIVYRIQQSSDIGAIKKSLLDYTNRYVSEGQVFVRSPEQIIQGMKKQQNTFTILLGVIGGISLLVGGIGVMNIQTMMALHSCPTWWQKKTLTQKPRNVTFQLIMSLSFQ